MQNAQQSCLAQLHAQAKVTFGMALKFTSVALLDNGSCAGALAAAGDLQGIQLEFKGWCKAMRNVQQRCLTRLHAQANGTWRHRDLYCTLLSCSAHIAPAASQAQACYAAADLHPLVMHRAKFQ